jgi:hypothetical protein
MIFDAERSYGVVRFVDVAPKFDPLASSRYLEQLRALNPSGRLDRYPGSALLAMRELGNHCSYIVCDLDEDSIEDLRVWAGQLGVDATVVADDGNATLYRRISAHDQAFDLFAHIDPYDPWSVGTSGVSALDLAAAITERGGGLMYWYGYSSPDERAWALDELAARTQRASLWCGDILVDTPAGLDIPRDGDLGAATTPGTGFGIVMANVSERTLETCQALGTALSSAYAHGALPNGSAGCLTFTTRHLERT